MAQAPRSPSSTSSSAGHGVHRSNSSAARPSLPPARRGRLKNGNRPGDFLAAPRCGAHTRCGGECRQPAMPNGRCRLHGGLSTGPRTPEGLARSRRARWKHGVCSAEVRALRCAARARLRRVRSVLTLMRAPSAGHGVDRSNSQSAVGARCARPPSSTRAPSSVGSRANGPRARAARPTRNDPTAGSPLGMWFIVPFRDRLCSSACFGHGVAKFAGGF